MKEGSAFCRHRDCRICRPLRRAHHLFSTSAPFSVRCETHSKTMRQRMNKGSAFFRLRAAAIVSLCVAPITPSPPPRPCNLSGNIAGVCVLTVTAVAHIMKLLARASNYYSTYHRPRGLSRISRQMYARKHGAS